MKHNLSVCKKIITRGIDYGEHKILQYLKKYNIYTQIINNQLYARNNVTDTFSETFFSNLGIERNNIKIFTPEELKLIIFTENELGSEKFNVSKNSEPKRYNFFVIIHNNIYEFRRVTDKRLRIGYDALEFYNFNKTIGNKLSACICGYMFGI